MPQNPEPGADSDAAPFDASVVEVPPGVLMEECPRCGKRVCRVFCALSSGGTGWVVASCDGPFEFPRSLFPIHRCADILETLQKRDRRGAASPPRHSTTDEPLTAAFTEDAPVAELCPAFSPHGQDQTMKTATDYCAAKGCQAKTQPQMLMCRAHWFQVPKALRDQIWNAHRAVQGGDESRKGEHLRACVDAIKAVKS